MDIIDWIVLYGLVGVCFGVACASAKNPPPKGAPFVLAALWPPALLILIFMRLVDD